MDPNNNQPINTNPLEQAAPQPVATPPSTQSTPVAPTPETTVLAEAPKVKGKKAIILLVILLLLVVGMIAYVLFAKNQLNKTQKTTADNSSVAIPSPSPTLVPTLAPEEDLEVNSPEADLLEIDADIKGL